MKTKMSLLQTSGRLRLIVIEISFWQQSVRKKNKTLKHLITTKIPPAYSLFPPSTPSHNTIPSHQKKLHQKTWPTLTQGSEAVPSHYLHWTNTSSALRLRIEKSWMSICQASGQNASDHTAFPPNRQSTKWVPAPNAAMSITPTSHADQSFRQL
jgi:hypothetical protein